MQKAKSIWDRSFFPVLLAYFIDNFGLAIVYPIFTPLFLRPHLHHLVGPEYTLLHRTLLLAFLIASFPLAQLFGAPFIGELADRVGRKKALHYTIIGGMVGYFLTGIGVQFEQIEILWFGRILAGFFAGNFTLCLCAVADITHTQQQRVKNFGAVGAIGGLAFVLAIFTGGFLSNPNVALYFHPSIPFHVPAVFCLINLFLLHRFYRDEPAMKPHDKLEFLRGLKNILHALATKGVRGIYFAYIFFMISWFTSLQFLSTYLIDEYNATTDDITLTFALIGAAWALTNFVLNPLLSKRFSPRSLFTVGVFALAAFLLIALIPSQPLPLIQALFSLAALSAALAWTNGLESISLTKTRGITGRIPGVNQTLVALATLTGPLIGGVIAGYDVEKLYLFTALCGLVGMLFLFFSRSGIRKA